MNTFDLIVIGAGPGGYVAAIGAAQRGRSVAVVEAAEVGGTCLNRGCVPTKAMMHSAHLYHELKTAARFGVTAEGASFDFAAIHANKDEVVASLRSGIEGLFSANGITLVRGKATLQSATEVSVATTEGHLALCAKNVIIATGAAPIRLPDHMMQLPNVVTSDELLATGGVCYRRLVIAGGGVIGVEFATLFAALGCEITIVEALPRILANMDRELSQNLTMILKKQGVTLHTSTRLEGIAESETGLCCTLQGKGEPVAVQADGVLVAIGRKPSFGGLFADDILPKMEGATLAVNEHFETSLPGVYAIGDCASGCVQLAHVASAAGLAAVAHICGEAAPIDLSAVPSCVYTSPEIATVGLSADEAKASGIPANTGKYVLSGNAKALLSGSERSFIKVISHAETGAVLGAQLMCDRATDMIDEFSVAIVQGLTVHQMASVMRPHPTFGEAASEALEDTFGRAIHLAPKRKPR